MKAFWAWPIIMIIMLTSLARADYHYASHEGSDEYPYISWETAAALIQDAVDATDPHDTVYIGAGDWYQHMETGVYDSVAIIGMGIDSTICHNDSVHIRIFVIDYGCSVEGITFTGAENGTCVKARVYAGVSVTNCRFLDSRNGVTASGYPLTIISDNIFNNCRKPIGINIWVGNFHIKNNLITNTRGLWAIYLQADTALVENNIIVNDEMVLVDAIGGAPNYSVIRNNIAMNGEDGIGAGRVKYNNTAINFSSIGYPSRKGDIIINNSIIGCYYGVIFSFEGDTSVAKYNAFWGNLIDIGIDEGILDSIGNIYVDPMLVGDGDFYLQAFSPLIDAGDPNVFDVDSTRSDIGVYGGPFGESYEYQDLPPAIPDSLAGQAWGDSIVLNWRYNTEADFSNYLLHKDTISGFEPSIFNLIAEPDTSAYLDIDIIPGSDNYYRLSALDNQGNESEYSEELAVIQTGIWNGMGAELPTVTTIKDNYPNPFNSSTTIIYSVANLGPIPAQINIDIYDILGRKVRSLIDDRMEVGIFRISWDGRDDAGDDCPSGVYFARITQWNVKMLGKNKKLVLMR